jgi:molybdopterin converting factor small subunit
MQSIKVTAVGHISLLLGAREIVLDCDGPLTVSAILDELRTRSPRFAEYLGELRDIEDYLMIGLGGRAMQLHSVVKPGEELVLVTPVSGG